ncbi:lipoprotein N-acyltransferase Lnb domain-containing protein [Porphyromonas circumdentaria]|uniref:Uncharacterized protein n=1 Tax=Porphyromonas circumdentaria TaxID=29524 RepID=A0A1T4MFY8_9PORP|nr:DUF4105 domain-containing protein [Porphyromonas circumdentaria]MBB6275771.1 hypothetical protein [Porphyromonas circumdentaria]SJZ65833.1 protein of unknown function [Porphyromonas circumdentaria]
MRIDILLKKEGILHLLSFGVFLSLLFPFRVAAQKIVPDSSSKSSLERDAPLISFIFNTPVEREVYSIYGHLGVRVQGKDGADFTYNYGVFDFDAPNFTINFITGCMDDFRLDKVPSHLYMRGYIYDADLYELELNLLPEEAKKMEAYLEDNLQPEKAFYRYNFLFDNCSTRPYDVVKEILSGRIELDANAPMLSRREMLDHCNTKRAWYKLGTDLSLGSQTDKTVSPEEQVFLPVYLIDIMRGAQIVSAEGEKRPLVKEEHFYPQQPFPYADPYFNAAPVAPTPMWLSPTFVFAFIASLILLFLLLIRKRNNLYWHSSRTLLIILFLIQGIAGSVIFFLTFFSLHPLVSPNWNLLFLNPLHLLVGVPSLLFLSKTKLLEYVMGLNIVGQISYILLLGIIGIQTSHPALIILAATSLLLSFTIIQCKTQRTYEQKK